jgi:fructose-1-phosphate kinase PfkB-like protein
MKSQSTVGAGDSMVGAMTLKLAQGASLLEMTRYGVAAGSAATINQGTRSVRLPIRKKSSITCPEINILPFFMEEMLPESPNANYRLC